MFLKESNFLPVSNQSKDLVLFLANLNRYLYFIHDSVITFNSLLIDLLKIITFNFFKFLKNFFISIKKSLSSPEEKDLYFIQFVHHFRLSKRVKYYQIF